MTINEELDVQGVIMTTNQIRDLISKAYDRGLADAGQRNAALCLKYADEELAELVVSEWDKGWQMGWDSACEFLAAVIKLGEDNYDSELG